MPLPQSARSSKAHVKTGRRKRLLGTMTFSEKNLAETRPSRKLCRRSSPPLMRPRVLLVAVFWFFSRPTLLLKLSMDRNPRKAASAMASTLPGGCPVDLAMTHRLGERGRERRFQAADQRRSPIEEDIVEHAAGQSAIVPLKGLLRSRQSNPRHQISEPRIGTELVKRWLRLHPVQQLRGTLLIRLFQTRIHCFRFPQFALDHRQIKRIRSRIWVSP